MTLRFFLLCAVLFYQIDFFAANIAAVSNGKWEDTSNWDCTCVPGAADDVTIDGYSIEIDVTTGNTSVNSITLTNTGSSQTVLEVNDGVTFTVSGNLSMTSENNNRAISFQAHNTSVTNIGGNIEMERTADNTVAAKLQLFMNSSSTINVTGSLIFNYQNSGGSEGNNEIDLNGTCALNVTQNVVFTHAGGNNFHCNLDNSAQFTIGGTFGLTQSGGDNAKVTLGVNCLLQCTGNMTFLKSGGNLDLDISQSGNSNLTTGGNIALTSTLANAVIDVSCSGNINVTGNFDLSAQTAGDITMALANDGTINLGGNFSRASGFGILTMGASSKIVYNGSGTQQMTHNTGAGGDTFEFTNIEVNNTSGNALTLTGEVTMTKHLTLTSGIIETTNSNKLIVDNGSSDSGSSSSHVDGPMIKKNSGTFTFPLGNNGVYAPISISNPGTSGDFTAQYFNTAYSNTSSMVGELQVVSPFEYWNLERTAGNDVEVTLGWEDANASGIFNLTTLRVAKFNGTDWESMGNNGTSGGTGAGVSGSITSNSASSFSPFTFGSTNTENFLPVELTFFEGRYDAAKKEVQLSWQTAFELNNDYFEIERSTDNRVFESLGTVSGYGTSYELTDYDFTDKNPPNGIAYYRLKQKDFDGNSAFSKTISVEVGSGILANIHFYPNPTDDFLYLEIPDLDRETDLNLTVSDISGRILRTENRNAFERHFYLNISELMPGLYFLNLEKDGKQARFKFLKN